MNIQQIMYFTAVCSKGSFSKAAASLGVTLQALSISMSKLETELGIPLFNRTGRGTVLTEHGKYFLPHANHILNEIDDVKTHFSSLGSESKDLKIAACAGTISEVGVSLFSKFRAQNPDIHLHLREFKDAVVDDELLRENCEIGICLEPVDKSQLDSVRISHQPLVLLLKDDHPLTNLERVPFAAIKNYPFIVVDEMFKSAGNFLDYCSLKGVQLNPAFRVGEVATVHQMVQRGEGIGLTVRTVAEGYATPGTTYRYFEEYDDDKLYWTLDVTKRRSFPLSKAGKAFYGYCIDYSHKAFGTDSEISGGEQQ